MTPSAYALSRREAAQYRHFDSMLVCMDDELRTQASIEIIRTGRCSATAATVGRETGGCGEQTERAATGQLNSYTFKPGGLQAKGEQSVAESAQAIRHQE